MSILPSHRCWIWLLPMTSYIPISFFLSLFCLPKRPSGLHTEYTQNSHSPDLGGVSMLKHLTIYFWKPHSPANVETDQMPQRSKQITKAIVNLYICFWLIFPEKNKTTKKDFPSSPLSPFKWLRNAGVSETHQNLHIEVPHKLITRSNK